jgi:TonB family protein
MLMKSFAIAVPLSAAVLALASSSLYSQERGAQGTLADVRGSLAKSPAIAASSDLDEYKRHFARRVAQANARTLADSLPPILKSVVVLDITVGADGALERVVVWRSNGYTDLERTALESVRRIGAAPPPPPQSLMGGASVRFLETFLFRPDGQYQVRSIAGETIPADRPTLVVEQETRL